MKQTHFNRLFHILLFTAAILMVVHVLGQFSRPIDRLLNFTVQKPLRFLEIKKEFVGYLWWIIPFYIHIGFGSVGILSGSIQFLLGKKIQKPRVHAGLGIMYLIGIGLASISGLYLSFFVEVTPIISAKYYLGKIGFIITSLLWIRSVFYVGWYVRKKNRTQHAAWAIRSFSLTMVVVSFRLIFQCLYGGLGYSFTDAYLLGIYASSLGNIILAEIIIYRSHISTWTKQLMLIYTNR